jgi:predicted aspartyl protease
VEIEQGGRRQQLRLLLDTGANRTTLHERQVMLLAFGESRSAQVTGVGGMRTQGRMVIVEKLRIGPFLIADLPAIVLENTDAAIPFDGILGNDVLRQLSYSVDFTGMAIHWQLQ